MILFVMNCLQVWVCDFFPPNLFLKPNSSKEATTAALALASSPELANCHLLKLSSSFSKLVVKREYPAWRLLSNAEFVRLCALEISSSWTFPCSSNMKLSFCQSQSFDIALVWALSSPSRVLVRLVRVWCMVLENSQGFDVRFWKLPGVWCPVLENSQGFDVRFWKTPRGLMSGFGKLPGVWCPVLVFPRGWMSGFGKFPGGEYRDFQKWMYWGGPSKPCKIQHWWFFLPKYCEF